MRSWFTSTDRKFMTKNHETLIKIPELSDEVNTFISNAEKVSTLTWFLFAVYSLFYTFILQMVHQGRSDGTFKLWAEKFANSQVDICINKISKISS